MRNLKDPYQEVFAVEVKDGPCDHVLMPSGEKVPLGSKSGNRTPVALEPTIQQQQSYGGGYSQQQQQQHGGMIFIP